MARGGLKREWRWLMQRDLSGADRQDRRRLPCQTCFAEATTALGKWTFEVIDWHTSYEAAVLLGGRKIASRMGIATRAEAQRVAEALATDFAKQVLEQLA